MTKYEFSSILQNETGMAIVQKYLFDHPPFYFKNTPGLFEDFRDEVCAFFKIHQQNFAIVGSAQIGFSLSPEHYGIPFGSTSDIDVVLVSEDLFQDLWMMLIEYRKKTFSSLDPLYRKKFSELQRILFFGNIRFDKLNDTFAFAKTWWDFFNHMSRNPKYGSRRVRASLFKSWHHVTHYYAEGIDKLKEKNESTSHKSDNPMVLSAP